MAQYTIRQMELLSGIRASTIRMWEKRYNIFSPQRTNTNIRRYDDNDLRFIINLSLLLKRGFRISKLASLSLEELSDLASKFVSDHRTGNVNIEPMITATIEYDEPELVKQINDWSEKHGIEYTFENVILPYLQRLGDLWQTGAISTTHEHFASNVIRNLLSQLYRTCKQPEVGKTTPIIFFLPEGEFHEIGLLYFAYVAKNAGYKTIYLGQSTPVEDVIKCAKDLNCKMVFTSLSSFVSADMDQAFKPMKEQLPDVEIIATGHAFTEKTGPSYLTYVSSSQDLMKIIARVDPTIIK
ncbi:MAG: MerR family transcriptional regulator, light-induced transcriptional regulator [Tenuifilum sp.]|uniref:MerR family transcriptional regulator n=1 Tax=Tenuifilum sp. TaxID=2760880 RepID=UPI0024AAD03B|nr:MerR family transcriptional regulator [Tenuifilum sp.]MDI3527364.1 MerR family transcriptional regulator, light-induced transcriptional regulator [Tenuifilum sp.]